MTVRAATPSFNPKTLDMVARLVCPVVWRPDPVVLTAEMIREAAMLVYHRWRAFLPHAGALQKAQRFISRCRYVNLPPYLASVAAELEAFVGKTPREINARLPDASRSAVNEALAILVRSGRATFDGEMGSRRYRAATGEPS